ncbi:MAG: hypothetical protein ACOX6M_06295 [Armatimonadota bacterium]
MIYVQCNRPTGVVAHGDPHATRPDGSWMPPMPPVMGDWVLVIERA